MACDPKPWLTLSIDSSCPFYTGSDLATCSERGCVSGGDLQPVCSCGTAVLRYVENLRVHKISCKQGLQPTLPFELSPNGHPSQTLGSKATQVSLIHGHGGPRIPKRFIRGRLKLIEAIVLDDTPRPWTAFRNSEPCRRRRTTALLHMQTIRHNGFLMFTLSYPASLQADA